LRPKPPPESPAHRPWDQRHRFDDHFGDATGMIDDHFGDLTGMIDDHFGYVTGMVQR